MPFIFKTPQQQLHHKAYVRHLSIFGSVSLTDDIQCWAKFFDFVERKAEKSSQGYLLRIKLPLIGEFGTVCFRIKYHMDDYH